MNRSLIVTLCLAGILSGSFLVLDDLDAGSDPSGLPEERLSANLVRVRINGKWEEFPLMPLADDLCASGNQFFERYCGDDIVGPGSN